MVVHHFTVTAVAIASIALALGYFVLAEAKRQSGKLGILGKALGTLIIAGVVLVSILRFVKVLSWFVR